MNTENKTQNKQQNTNNQIIRDPNLAKNRVFVGNLPQCTREELESIFLPYGKVIGSLVQRNFGFVQFESEDIAGKASSALNKSTFKGNLITVRNANCKQTVKKTVPDNAGAAKPLAKISNLTPTDSSANPDYNDCEIIVVDRKNTKYAEYIEQRLKDISLRVDVLYPNEDVALGKVLANISSRGCLYAVLVTNQHEEHNSITVNILYGQPAEHRNMPVDDAIQLIAKDFRAKLARDAIKKTGAFGGGGAMGMGGNLPKQVPIIPPLLAGPTLKERHPQAMQILLNLLAENMPLTVVQYDRIIKYLQERRTLQVKVELGDAAEPIERAPDPEIELQKKILTILNKPSVAETHYNLMYSSLETVKEDYRIMDLLKDVRVQKALEALMDSNLVSTVETHMKF